MRKDEFLDEKKHENNGAKSLKKMMKIMDFLADEKGSEIDEIEITEIEKKAVDFWAINRFKDSRKAYLFSLYYP